MLAILFSVLILVLFSRFLFWLYPAIKRWGR